MNAASINRFFKILKIVRVFGVFYAWRKRKTTYELILQPKLF